MELRRELVLLAGALVALNIAVAFGAIGLFTRMSPAIERIMQDNVYSIEAAEDMLAVLAEAGGQAATDPDRRRFAEALARTRDNITEPREAALIDAIERDRAAALAGQPGRVEPVIAALGELIAVNRRAVAEADLTAQRLGEAGAWAAVFIAVFSFVVSVVVFRRLQARITAPLVELDRVLAAAASGDIHRRCRAMDAPAEIVRVLQEVNGLLDRRLE